MKTKIILLLSLVAGQAVHAQTNTQLGTSAGARNTGTEGTFIGYNAGADNKGTFVTTVGAFAGFKNTGQNTAFFGWNAGSGNTASSVTAVGSSAGIANKGVGGVFVGRNAGAGNQGLNNTAIGLSSGRSGISGEHNTFLGAFSGEKNTVGLHNTYIGAESGRLNQFGIYNTFLGMRAGSESTGSQNVLIGYEAGKTLTASHKLVIAHGISSATPLITGDFKAKHVAIGGFGDPKFTLHVLGTAHTTGTFTSSDARFKQNVQPIEKPAEKLLAIKGVSYEFKPSAARNFPEGKTYGFIAQDVQKALPALVKEDKDGYLALNYDCFIPLLVEGFKDLKGEYQQLAAENDQLRRELDQLKKALLLRGTNGTPGALTNPGESRVGVPAFPAAAVGLHQNEPNPFDRQTSIRYQVAAEARDVTLRVYDQSGVLRMQYHNLRPGAGAVAIEAGQLPAGTYLYSLDVDGKVADSKRMVLTR